MGNVLLYADDVTEVTEAGEIDVVDENCRSLFQALLPYGPAWSRDPNGELFKISQALAYEYSRIKRRGRDLLDEVDPDTCFELLEDLERVYGLPLSFGTPPTTIAGRRAALHGRMVGFGNPTKTYLQTIAANLGYDVEIHTYTGDDLFTCTSACTDPLYERFWIFVWDVLYHPVDVDEMLIGSLSEVAPLHTVPRFFMGLDWTAQTSGVSGWLNGLTDHAGLWVAVGDHASAGLKALVVTSPDGVTWTTRTSATAVDKNFAAVCSDGTTLVAVGSDGVINTSTNGITWTSRTSPYGAGGDLYAVTWSSSLGLFVATGKGGRIATSPTGVTWTSRASGVITNLYGIAAGGTYLVAVGGSATVLTSTNGTAWTAQTGATIASITEDLYAADYSADDLYFTAVGDKGVVISVLSNPTTTWAKAGSAAMEDAFLSVSAGPASAEKVAVVAVGGSLSGSRGIIKASLSQDEFYTQETTAKELTAVAQRQDGSTSWVVVGESGTVLTASY